MYFHLDLINNCNVKMFAKRSSVINSIYSGQQQFSYTIYKKRVFVQNKSNLFFLSITTFSLRAFSQMTLSIMTFSIPIKKSRHSANDIQHNSRFSLCWVLLCSISLCSMTIISPLCWMSLWWVSLLWKSLCWVSWRHEH